MNLASPRLKLDEVTWSDLELIHRLNSCPESDEFNTLGIPESIETTREVIRRSVEDQESGERKFYCWVIRRDVEFVGEIGMNVGPPKYKRAEIYFSIMPSMWCNGYATEAAEAVIKFGFEELQLHRIEAGAATKNVASIRVLGKIGMTREGIGRKILPIRGDWVDNYSYSMLDTDSRNY